MSQDNWSLEEEGFFTRLLRHAGASPYQGKICITTTMGYTREQLSALLGVDVKDIQGLLDTMVKQDRITVNKAGVIAFNNWDHYQTPYRDRVEYQKQYYDIKRDTGIQPPVQPTVQPASQPTGDRDRDIDRDRDKNKNKIKTSLSVDDRRALTVLMERWNQSAIRKGWIKCVVATDDRVRHLKARQREGFNENIDKVLLMMEQNDWNSGRNNSGWKASIDYILQPGSWAKLLERSADFKETQKPKGPRAEMPEL